MGKVIYICEDCGREYVNKPPFPQPCACGNICEEFYRLKDIYDEEDEKTGRPLLGIKYDEEILKEKSEGILQPIEVEDEPKIDYKSMTKRELQMMLSAKRIKYTQLLNKGQLIKLIEGK